MLTIEEVLSIARETAKRIVGGEMNEYFVESVTYQVKYRNWRVRFEEKGPSLSFDGCFKVFVDDTTKESEFRACP